jgi:hypothetical protein
MIFPYDELINIHEQAIAAGLHNKRDQMLFGVNSEFVAGLDDVSSPRDQLLSDLNAMNEAGTIIGGAVPLERWLRNAAYAMSTRPDKQRFFRERADEAARSAPPGDGDPALASSVKLERILFVADLLPFGFLAGAARIGRSVARMIVPRFEGGHARTHPTSSDPVLYYGTGWLIGATHVITNHHVVNARSEGEAPADPADFELRGQNLTVQFDYDQDDVPGEKFPVAAVAAADSELDYAILELAGKPGRAPLPLWGRPIDFTDGSQLPVNIIQHPGGQAKQMAIRKTSPQPCTVTTSPTTRTRRQARPDRRFATTAGRCLRCTRPRPWQWASSTTKARTRPG